MEFGNYEVNTVVVPGMGTNCYVLSFNNKAILVDAAADGKLLIDYIANKQLDLISILITHGHYDHIEALDLLYDNYKDVKIYACIDEKEVIENEKLSLMGHRLKEPVEKSIIYLKDGAVINELGLDIKIISTPGHTVGSCCYYIKDINLMFSGDTLFRQTYGRTDLPTGDQDTIIDSITRKLMEFDDDLLVLPGHGFRTTIGYERTHNDIVINHI